MDSRIYRKIWEGYKIYARGASVIRKGYENAGAAIVTDDSLELRSTFIRRSESILEHQAKTAWLASVFASNFPTFFGEDRTVLPLLDFWKVLTTGLCHDVGEIKGGDVLDNGSRKHDVKDREELEVFAEFIEVYDPTDQEELLAFYKAFQQRDSYLGRALYSLDKTEAVLTHLLLESHGIYGNLSAVPKPTSQDIHYAIVSGSKFAADTWGCQMWDIIKEYPTSITAPIFGLLKTASTDVRGESFIWLQGIQ